MTFSPSGNEPYRLIAIDPGSRFMGVGILSVDLLTGVVNVIEATTFVIDAFLKLQPTPYTHGETVERQLIISGILRAACERHNPHGFVAEDFYLQGNASTYRSLAECMLTAKTTVKEYNNAISFMTFTASNIKKTVGVKGTSGVKEEVSAAVADIKDIVISSDIDQEKLDEHAWDTIAIGYTAAQRILDNVAIRVNYQESSVCETKNQRKGKKK